MMLIMIARIAKLMKMDDNTIEYYHEMENIIKSLADMFGVPLSVATDLFIELCQDIAENESSAPTPVQPQKCPRVFAIDDSASVLETIANILDLVEDDAVVIVSIKTGEVLAERVSDGVWEILR